MDLSTRLHAIWMICDIELARRPDSPLMVELLKVMAKGTDDEIASRKQQFKLCGIDLVELEMP